MNGYMKLYLASETDEPIWQVAGDWVNTAKRTKYMSKARKYSVTMHLVNDRGQKAVSTYKLRQKIATHDISVTLLSLVQDMVSDMHDERIDLNKSYVVLRGAK